jgi:hypothetical protein
MRERGLYQIQLMKTRSSSGVGQKIELKFDVETLRITDEGEDTNYKPQPTGTQLLNQVKVTSQVGAVTTPAQESVDPITGEIEPEKNKVVADVQSAKLKSLLASLKK